MSDQASVRDRWSVDADWFCQVALIVLIVNAPAFLTDDAWLFNYFNNVDQAPALFYNANYVHLLPQMVAYAVSGLPFVAQALLYRAVPFFLVLCLYRQLRQLFAIVGPAAEAWIPAIAIVLVLRVREPSLFGTLAYSTWTAFILAFVYLLRLQLTQSAFTRVGFVGVAIGALTLPLGILLVPLLLVMALRSQGRQRWQSAALAAILLAAALLISTRVPESPVRVINPVDAVWVFLRNFRTNKLDNLVATFGMVALVVNGFATYWLEASSPRRIARWSLSYIGLGSMAVYFASNRFLREGRGFEGVPPRFALPALTCALIAIALTVMTQQLERRRWLLLGSGLGGAVALLALLLYTELRGPLETALMRYRFLQVAAEFRQTCRPGEAFLYEDDDTSPLVLCRRQTFTVGYQEFPNIPPTVGFGVARTEGLPGILVGKPLFP